MTAAETHERLDDLYGAFNGRDMETVLSALAPDVQWPNGIEGGWVRGREAVRDYWTRQWAIIDPHVEPVAMEDDGAGRTAVRVHQVVRDLTGAVISEREVRHVYTFVGGLVSRMEIEA